MKRNSTGHQRTTSKRPERLSEGAAGGRGTAIAWGAVMVQQAVEEFASFAIQCPTIDAPTRARILRHLEEVKYAADWLDDALVAVARKRAA